MGIGTTCLQVAPHRHAQSQKVSTGINWPTVIIWHCPRLKWGVHPSVVPPGSVFTMPNNYKSVQVNCPPQPTTLAHSHANLVPTDNLSISRHQVIKAWVLGQQGLSGYPRHWRPATHVAIRPSKAQGLASPPTWAWGCSLLPPARLGCGPARNRARPSVSLQQVSEGSHCLLPTQSASLGIINWPAWVWAVTPANTPPNNGPQCSPMGEGAVLHMPNWVITTPIMFNE